MIITFISCFLNHHQLPICLELESQCDEFHFVATDPIPDDRTQLGYEDLNTKYDFVLRAYDGSTDESTVKRLLRDSDVVIFGSCPDEYMEERMELNKLSFLYSERFFKKGVWRRFIPTTRRKIYNRLLRYKDKELYVLCASAFLPWDLKLCGFDTDKCFRWGYFPSICEYEARPRRSNDPLKILWAGRMLPLKNAEAAVDAVSAVIEKGLDFSFDFIGMGECEQSLRKKVKALGIDNKVNFLGAMTPDMVIKHMESSDIFLMTSNYREGWGAVINEAMSTGCAVLASSAVGSAAYLIDNDNNGLVYEFGNPSDFAAKLSKLISDREYTQKLGDAAFRTIHSEYCAAVAVKRFLEFSRCKDKESFGYETGPMSKAPVIKNNWYKI